MDAHSDEVCIFQPNRDNMSLISDKIVPLTALDLEFLGANNIFIPCQTSVHIPRLSQQFQLVQPNCVETNLQRISCMETKNSIYANV